MEAAEQGRPIELDQWLGLLVPTGTPGDKYARLVKELGIRAD